MIETKDLIGKRKYEALKRHDFKKMSASEMVYFRETFKISVADAEKKIADYEKYTNRGSNTKKNQEYFERLSNLNSTEKKVTLNKQELWNAFKLYFELDVKKPLIQSEDFLENLKPLFYYFTGNLDSFKRCSRVSDVSIPGLDKGLLIIGDFGNGKSTIMNVLERCMIGTSKYFKGYSANDVVLQFEGCESPSEREFLIKRMSKGTLYFDDIKSERMANNYGKTEIFREIFENRYNNKAKTFVTCNYKKGYEGDLGNGLVEFGEKYGNRVYDRIFEMYNVIEFKGKSLRK